MQSNPVLGSYAAPHHTPSRTSTLLSISPFFTPTRLHMCFSVAFRATLKRKNTLAHLDLEKEKQKASLGKKGGLAGSGTGNSTPTTNGNGSVIGGGISLGARASPTLSAVSKATLVATKKSPSPSPPLKPPKKLIKSTNGILQINNNLHCFVVNMMLGSAPPVVQANNEQRLGALYRYDILDTPPEVSFDGIQSSLLSLALIVSLLQFLILYFRYCKNGICCMR
jgi:hypothetical protein